MCLHSFCSTGSCGVGWSFKTSSARYLASQHLKIDHCCAGGMLIAPAFTCLCAYICFSMLHVVDVRMRVCALMFFLVDPRMISVCLLNSLHTCYSAVCNLPRDSGSCGGDIEGYYFNTQTGQCEMFRYGGCGGNGNHFSSERACARACECRGKKACGWRYAWCYFCVVKLFMSMDTGLVMNRPLDIKLNSCAYRRLAGMCVVIHSYVCIPVWYNMYYCSLQVCVARIQ